MALLFRSSVDSEARWKPQLGRLMPELEVRVWPEVGDPADIDYALVAAGARPFGFAPRPQADPLSECRLSNFGSGAIIGHNS